MTTRLAGAYFIEAWVSPAILEAYADVPGFHLDLLVVRTRFRADGWPVRGVRDGRAEAGARARGGREYECMTELSPVFKTVEELRAGSPLFLDIGGERFHTMAVGPPLRGAGRLQLHRLYYDSTAPKWTGQFFASFDVRTETR